MLLFSGFSPVVDALCFEQTLILVLIIISLIRSTQETERAEKTFWQMMRRNSYFSQSSWIARLLENNKDWTFSLTTFSPDDVEIKKTVKIT